MLNAISGWSTANIYSYPIKKGEVLFAGEWVKFEDDALTEADKFDGLKAVFPVYMGNKEAYDIRYHNRAEVVTASSGVLETDNFEAEAFVPGDALTVAAGKLTKAAKPEEVVGYVVRPVEQGRLQFKLK